MPFALTKGLVAAAIAFLISCGSMPLAAKIGYLLGITASPAIKTARKVRIPATGGISIVVGIVASLAATASLSWWLLLGVPGLFAVGLMDDARAMAPRQKFIWQLTIIVFATIVFLPRYEFTPSPALNLAITIFWLAATTNAFNLIDGLDGLAAGVGIVSAAAIALAAMAHGSAAVAISALVVCASLGGFLVHNFSPASIIMGDAGALPLGFLLGVLALEGGRLATNSSLTIWVFPVLVMLVPLLDTAVVMVTRTTTGKTIAWRGLDHVHDRLLSLGLNDRQVAIAAWLSAIFAATCAVEATRLPHANLVVSLPFFALAAAVIALFTIDLTFDTAAPVEAHGSLRGMARLILSLSYRRRLAEGILDLLVISAAYCGAVALRVDFNLNAQVMHSIAAGMPWIVVLTYSAFIATGVYRGIWRHISLADLVRLMSGGALAAILIAIASNFLPIRHSGSIAVIYAILLGNLLVATRSSFALLRKFINSQASVADRVLVVGAGAAGAMAANFVLQTRPRTARLVGFVDADIFRLGKMVEGLRVLGSPENLGQIFERKPFTEILVADPDLSVEHLEQIFKFGKDRDLPVRSIAMQVTDLLMVPMPGLVSAKRAA